MNNSFQGKTLPASALFIRGARNVYAGEIISQYITEAGKSQGGFMKFL